MFRLIDIATGEVCDQGGREAAGYTARAGVLCSGARAEVPRLQVQPVAESLATTPELKPVEAWLAILHLELGGRWGERWKDIEDPPIKVTRGECRFQAQTE